MSALFPIFFVSIFCNFVAGLFLPSTCAISFAAAALCDNVQYLQYPVLSVVYASSNSTHLDSYYTLCLFRGDVRVTLKGVCFHAIL